MLFVDQLRGPHSTGIAVVRNYDDAILMAKAVGGVECLMETKAYDEAIKTFPKVMIGHNRFATMGKITRNNAHPFHFENVVGAHNGSLRNFKNLKGFFDYPVDSQVLYNSINEDGLEHTLANIEGAYALTYWDKKTKKMNFIRNTERPLYLALTKNEKTILWASESWMIEGIAERNNVELSTIVGLDKDTLLTVEIPTIKNKLVPHIRAGELKGGTALTTSVVVPFRGNGFAGSNNASNVAKTGTGAANSSTIPLTADEASAQAKETAEKVAASLQSPIGAGPMTFRAGFKGCTLDGAKFITLAIDGDPREYRLYLNKQDYGVYNSGDTVKGNITSMQIIDNAIIYKMGHLSAENLTTKVREIIDGTSLKERADKLLGITVEEMIDEPEATYEDHMGRKYVRDEFIKRHGFCAYCNGNVDPELGYRFIKDEVLCDDCCNNAMIVDILSQ